MRGVPLASAVRFFCNVSSVSPHRETRRAGASQTFRSEGKARYIGPGDIITHCPRPLGRGRRPEAGWGGGYSSPHRVWRPGTPPPGPPRVAIETQLYQLLFPYDKNQNRRVIIPMSMSNISMGITNFGRAYCHFSSLYPLSAF